MGGSVPPVRYKGLKTFIESHVIFYRLLIDSTVLGSLGNS